MMFKKSSGIMTEDSLRYIAMVSKAEFYDVSSSRYFPKVLHIDFYSGYRSLHSHQQCISTFPTSLPAFIKGCFLCRLSDLGGLDFKTL